MASASEYQSNQTQNTQHVQCCIAGCGPAGALLGLLLARQGIEVLVLEKHGDFLRDFRGDTIHPSTMQIMDELSLADQVLQLPHAKTPVLHIQTPQGTLFDADFSRLKTRWPYLVFLPQWDFLTFLTDKAKHFPTFHLLMNAEAQELIEENGAIRGIRYKTSDGWHTVSAVLTVAADGRSSQLRAQTRLELRETSPPMDVLWFRISRHDSDPVDTFFNFSPGHLIGMIDRRTYWQVAYLIPKGTAQRIQDAGVEQLQRSLSELIPWLADRVHELETWEKVKLLVVQANRLRRWYQPGLLCIGDAAHAMSPVAGVGINLAIQDAVVAANVLTEPLRAAQVQVRHLAAVQRRREWPTRIIQLMQSILQQRVIAPALSSSRSPTLPFPVRALLALPGLHNLPARLVGLGVWPVHVKKRYRHKNPNLNPTPV